MIKKLAPQLSTFGLLLFFALFWWAAARYPGGSQANPDAVGFDWKNNYWCNLLNEKALNGQINPGRPVALSGMVVLAVSAAVFFYQFPLSMKPGWSKLVKTSGVSASLLSALMFTQWHDEVTILGSILLAICLVGVIKAVFHTKQRLIQIWGAVGLMLVVANNAIYYTSAGIGYLPVVQKITFLVIGGWMMLVNRTKAVQF
jgi:hypothetical protein